MATINGHTYTMRGHIILSDGTVKAGVPVDIYEYLPPTSTQTARFVKVASGVTDSNGDYNINVSSLNYSVLYAEARVGKDVSSGCFLMGSFTLVSDENNANQGDTINLTATLLDNHGNGFKDETITFINTGTGTSIGSGVTNSSGQCTVSYISPGRTFDIVATVGGKNINSNNVRITSFDGITLTSDKNSISYNGGNNPESATLTAQLTNKGSAVGVSGETVTFEVRKASDDSLVETLTGTTNSSGIATVSYLGKGVGDVNIKAECMLLIQICTIHDYPFITYEKSGSSLLSDINSTWIKSENAVIADRDPYTRLSGSGKVEFPYELPNDFELEYTVKYHAETDNSCEMKMYSDENPEPGYDVRFFFWQRYVGPRGVNGENYGNLSVGSASEYTCKIIMQEGVLSFYVNNTLKASRGSQPSRSKRYLKFEVDKIIYLKSIKITRL